MGQQVRTFVAVGRDGNATAKKLLRIGKGEAENLKLEVLGTGSGVNMDHAFSMGAWHKEGFLDRVIAYRVHSSELDDIIDESLEEAGVGSLPTFSVTFYALPLVPKTPVRVKYFVEACDPFYGHFDHDILEWFDDLETAKKFADKAATTSPSYTTMCVFECEPDCDILRQNKNCVYRSPSRMG